MPAFALLSTRSSFQTPPFPRCTYPDFHQTFGLNGRKFPLVKRARKMQLTLRVHPLRITNCPSNPRTLVPIGLLYARRPSDRKSTRLNSSHLGISYAVFCL